MGDDPGVGRAEPRGSGMPVGRAGIAIGVEPPVDVN